MCITLVFALAGGDNLRPIALRTWAGKLEREKGAGPFAMLDERSGFLDIRAKREEGGGWMKEVGR